MQFSRKKARRILTLVLIGGTSTSADILTILVGQRLGLEVITSITCGFVVGTLFAHVQATKFLYRKTKSRALVLEISAFILVSAFGLVLTQVIIGGLMNIGTTLYTAKLVAVPAVFVIGSTLRVHVLNLFRKT